MKKLLLTLLLFVGLASNAQSTIFQDNFESYQDFIITGIGGWTMRDVDLLPTYGIGAAPNQVVFANLQPAFFGISADFA